LQLQRALLQYSKPENANLVREALRIAGREDLIGNTPDCLVRPAFGEGRQNRVTPDRKRGTIKPSGPYSGGRGAKNGVKSSAKKSKIDRVFGQDAERIKKEAARISGGSSKSSKNRASSPKNGSISRTNRKKK